MSDSLLSLADKPLPIDKVHVREIGEDVWCQGLTALGRSKWERSFLKKNSSKYDQRSSERARGSLLALCVIKSETDRSLRYSSADIEQLMKLSATVIEPIYDKCRELSGIGDKDADDLEQASAETVVSDSASS